MVALRGYQQLKSKYHLDSVNTSYSKYERYNSHRMHQAKEFVVGTVFTDMLSTFDSLSTELLSLEAATDKFTQVAVKATYDEMQMANHTIEMEFDL